MTEKNLKVVYTGSVVEASYIKSMLEENNIPCIQRDSLTESVHAGWASGSPESSNRIFVDEVHETEAKKFVAEFLKSNNTES